MVLSELSKDGVLQIVLARPQKRNAMDQNMIREIRHVFKDANENNDVRFIKMRGEGEHFCAGADLNWMKQSVKLSKKENQAQTEELFDMYQCIFECQKPIINFVHGAAIGGGVGLVACSDYVVAAKDSKYGFAEVKLGLVPATIGVFVAMKIGFTNFNAHGVVGERFNAETALRIGLVHELCEREELSQREDELTKNLLKNGPMAMCETKKMAREFAVLDWPGNKEKTSKLLARIRSGSEAQEGIAAFFEKRSPNWP